MTDFFKRSLIVHQPRRGTIAVVTTVPVQTREVLSIAYAPKWKLAAVGRAAAGTCHKTKIANPASLER